MLLSAVYILRNVARISCFRSGWFNRSESARLCAPDSDHRSRSSVMIGDRQVFERVGGNEGSDTECTTRTGTGTYIHLPEPHLAHFFTTHTEQSIALFIEGTLHYEFLLSLRNKSRTWCHYNHQQFQNPGGCSKKS